MRVEINDLVEFLNTSPTAWHAVENAVSKLSEQGFEELSEADRWQLKPGGRYYIIRNGSTLCAFVMPTKTPESVRVVASHTDSPAFKIKPQAEFRKENMIMLGVEIYGAPLLASWLNRDLGIAGRVLLKRQKTIEERLVLIDDAPLIIPQLALHLDRTVNEAGPILNKQEHLSALAALDTKKASKTSYLEKLLKRKYADFQELLSYDLFLYPLEPARLIGEDQQMIASYRIDSLGSVHAALSGFLESGKPHSHCLKMIVFWDHEEIGSHSANGAASPFFQHTLERIAQSREAYFQLMNRSLCVSVDLTHAMHPNYADRHDPRHAILMNQGIAIKVNSQHRYATDARSAAVIIDLCQKLKMPFQHYVARNDIPSGSTIGPIHASQTGMPTVDIGISQLSMHSNRELAGCQDYLDMRKLLKEYLSLFGLKDLPIDRSVKHSRQKLR